MEELLRGNLTDKMLKTLLHRYENQLSELDSLSKKFNVLKEVIKNITTAKKEITKRIKRSISKVFNCSSFAKYLKRNLNDLEFKREDKYLVLELIFIIYFQPCLLGVPLFRSQETHL